MKILENYLKSLRRIRSMGANVPETSFYPALSELFNEVGKSLKPKVACVMNLADIGAGMPDGGFYTSNQIQAGEPRPGQLPERGVLEAKGLSANVSEIANSEQVIRYCTRYNLVLVTNYREFALIGRNPQGAAGILESFSLTADEQSFWSAAEHPRTMANEKGQQFEEFLKRILLYNAPLTEPQDLAWFLASYARDAKYRVETHANLSALANVHDALENALGMKFTDEQGEHFFRSTLVQTIFYGVFSAWVLWHRENPQREDNFDWRVAEWFLQVPFIRTLYHQVASPDQLGPLGLVELLDLTALVLNRVERSVFFEKFNEEQAVQYFYEPFLQAFDPELRKQLGVWYTPPEIVKYQVARVDTVLREELGLADGLADPNVVVLDPCCGTGAYLVEVLRKIAETLEDKGGEALVAHDLKQAAMKRVFGFEILPAPFVVAHLQLGLILQRLGAPLNASVQERVGVYLTNALTGWEPPEEPQRLLFPELAAERDAAERVKQKSRILVVIGNPPYNAFAGVSPEEERGLVEPYKEKLSISTENGGWGIRRFNLDDLYVRFFRLAERRIAEMTGKGVVSFISNFSYLRDPSFVVMRKRFFAEFDKLWFDCMNGDSRETGKLTPEGKPDPSVFSTQYNREGIRVGTAVCVMVRKDKRRKNPVVSFRDFWGKRKRDELLNSLEADNINAEYAPSAPAPENRYSFVPQSVSNEYQLWCSVPEICETRSNGLMEKRGGALIDVDENDLEQRMRDYLNPEMNWHDYKAKHIALTQKQAAFDPVQARKKAVAEGFVADHIRRYAVRPFDTRWCYYTDVPTIWNSSRFVLFEQCFEGNSFLLTRPSGVASPEGVPFFFTRLLGDNDLQRGHSYYFPIRKVFTVRNGHKNGKIFKPTANISPAARAYLSSLGVEDPDTDIAAAELIWMHALAIGYSPAYLEENADGIRRDWPRIPLPKDRNALEASADLGRRVAALLDTEADVPGVTEGTLSAVFKTAARALKVGGGALNPDAGDLAVTAGWGHAGKGGVTMPGKGRLVQRDYEQAERDAIAEAAESLGLTAEQGIELLGPTTFDVYLNETAYWKNVPANVWGYYIGGYQVVKKWLSYREEKLLGRPLHAEEVREVTNMVRRLTGIILLQPTLDDNYHRVASDTYPWPSP